MTGKNPHEWLSAYLDGELRGNERKEAEQRLESSTEARRELRQFQKISALLQELPHEQPPEEFAARVMLAAERRSVLPQPTSSATSWSLRRIGAMAIGIAGTAVCVLIAVQLFAPLGKNKLDLAAKKPAGEGAADEVESVTLVESKSLPRSLAISEAAAAELEETDSVAVPTAKGQLSLPKGVRLTKALIGQLIDVNQTTAGSVAIVKVIVVDVEQGIGGIEVLLQKHSVTQVQPATESIGATEGKASGEIAALYVESTPTQIAQFLSDMGTLNEKGELVLELESNQVALVDLPAEPQSFFNNSVVANRESARVKQEAKGKPRPAEKAVTPELSRQQRAKVPLKIQNRLNQLDQSKKSRGAAKPNVEKARNAEQPVRLIILVERAKKASSDKKKTAPPAVDPPGSDV